LRLGRYPRVAAPVDKCGAEENTACCQTREAAYRATASVARSGVYDATQLLLDESVSLRDFADRLRERGIFLEKLEMVGIIPVPEMARSATAEEPLNPS
jgi:hypothetical protein